MFDKSGGVSTPGITTARDYAEQTIRQSILDGGLTPGERINEVLLSDQLGISRGPVREALQKLASEQLVTIVRNKGAFVASVDSGELHDLYEVRIAIETRASLIVAKKEDSSLIEELVKMLDATTSLMEGHKASAYPSGLDFHGTIIAMTENEALSRFGSEVQTRIQLARTRSARDPHRATEALKEHRNIVQAIIDGDGVTAAKLMEEHLWHSYENAVVHLTT